MSAHYCFFAIKINISRFLKENHVHGLRAEGDCCWELFLRPKYQGKKTQTISPGKETLPEFQPISLKKMLCDE